MEDKEISSEKEMTEWFETLPDQEKKQVMEKAKQIILARNKRSYDKLSFVFEGENPKIVAYEKGEEPKQ